MHSPAMPSGGCSVTVLELDAVSDAEGELTLGSAQRPANPL